MASARSCMCYPLRWQQAGPRREHCKLMQTNNVHGDADPAGLSEHNQQADLRAALRDLREHSVTSIAGLVM